jgi:hypothetical protein
MSSDIYYTWTRRNWPFPVEGHIQNMSLHDAWEWLDFDLDEQKFHLMNVFHLRSCHTAIINESYNLVLPPQMLCIFHWLNHVHFSCSLPWFLESQRDPSKCNSRMLCSSLFISWTKLKDLKYSAQYHRVEYTSIDI